MALWRRNPIWPTQIADAEVADAAKDVATAVDASEDATEAKDANYEDDTAAEDVTVVVDTKEAILETFEVGRTI